jgi:hypothetical protein
MAPAVFQGFAAHQSHKPTALDSDQAKKLIQYLTNTCHAWREDGYFVKEVKKKFNMA